MGLVGGATKVHPPAQAVIKVLEVSTAQELGEIIVAVGLAQNVAACRALVAEGIQRGHMSLHASNVALAAGATPEELPVVVARLIKDKAVRQDHAERVLAELRSAAETPPRDDPLRRVGATPAAGNAVQTQAADGAWEVRCAGQIMPARLEAE